MGVKNKQGAGGAGAGGEDDEGGGDGAVTMDAVKALVDASVNGAVKAQIKRALGSPEFTSAITAAVKAAVKPAGDDEGGSDDEGDEGAGNAPATPRAKGAAADPAVQAQLAELAKANRQLKATLAAEQRARTEAAERGRRDEERQRLTEALIAGGVDKGMVKGAIALLLHEERRVKRAADGTDGTPGAIMFHHADEDHDVDAGVKAWLGTPDGQRYLAPAPVQGTGGRGGSPPAGKDKGAVMTDAQLGAALAAL